MEGHYSHGSQGCNRRMNWAMGGSCRSSARSSGSAHPLVDQRHEGSDVERLLDAGVRNTVEELVGLRGENAAGHENQAREHVGGENGELSVEVGSVDDRHHQIAKDDDEPPV